MKGYFKPKNPRKYEGNPTNIIYRSSWEFRVMTYLDSNPNVISWSSEEFCIPYTDPTSGRFRRYFPDFKVKKKDANGNVRTLVVEVKPLYQTKPPTVQTKKTQRYINEVKTWAINQSKWESAKDFCDKRDWDFVVLTEREIFS